MELKLDEGGHVVVEDGKPVYTVDGKDVPYDVPAMMDKIRELNQESAERRVRLEEADAKLKSFKGLDAKAAREALKFREALGEDADPKKVADKLASLEADREALVSQLEQSKETLAGKEQHIWKLTVGHDIAASQWVKENVIEAFTPDRLERLYGDNFKIKDGRPVAYVEGKKLMSRERPGEPATVDEALALMIGNDKTMLKAGNASGSGSSPTLSTGNGKYPSPGKALDWKLARPHEKTAFIREHGLDAYKQLVDQMQTKEA